VVPRDGALGWRKTHFGHPDRHIGRHLAWALILGYNRLCELDIPSARLDCFVGEYGGVEFASPVPRASFGTLPPLALLVHLLKEYISINNINEIWNKRCGFGHLRLQVRSPRMDFFQDSA
jgi:hypothetical protein